MRRFASSPRSSFVGAAAFAQDVKTDFDKSANFGAIKTFAGQDRHELEQPDQREADHRRVHADARPRRAGSRSRPIPTPSCCSTARPRSRRTLNTFYSGGRLRGLRLPRLGRHGRHGHRHHDHRIRVPGRHPRRGHLRREDEGAHVPGHGLGRDLGQAREERQEGREGREKMFKDFPPGSKEKK